MGFTREDLYSVGTSAPSTMSLRTKPFQRQEAVPGDICAALFSRGDGIHYSWTFLIPSDKDSGKILSIEENGVWGYKSTEIAFAKAPMLVVVVKLGRLDSSGMSVDDLDEAVKRVPVPKSLADMSPGIRNEYWFRDALNELNEYGFITCNNVPATVTEVRGLAKILESRNARHAHYVSVTSS